MLYFFKYRLGCGTRAGLQVAIEFDDILDILFRETFASVEINIETSLIHSLKLLESDSAGGL